MDFVCYGLNVPFPRRSHYWNLITKVMVVGGWVFGRWLLDHEVRASVYLLVFPRCIAKHSVWTGLSNFHSHPIRFAKLFFILQVGSGKSMEIKLFAEGQS